MASAAEIVTIYELLSAADAGDSKSGEDLNVSKPLKVSISNRFESAPSEMV